jgi:hypothetical protein
MAFLAFAGTAQWASATDDVTPTTEEDQAAVLACAAFGEGYVLVPGTNTCVKVEGFVRFDTSVSGGSHSGGARSGDSNPPAPDIQLHFNN